MDDGLLLYRAFQMTDEVDDLWRRLAAFKPRYIVMEDFEYRPRHRTNDKINLFPVELIGVARLYALMVTDHQCAIYLQKASQGKGYYTDPVLKKLGLHKRGLPHAMDASRHLLHWFTFGAGYQYNKRPNTERFAMLAE
jgi:hypothetical protein